MFDISVEGGAVTASMGREPVNAINEEWIDELNRLLDAHEANENIRVIRIRSSLAVFCAGADIDLLAERLPTRHGIDAMIETVRRLQNLFDRIERSPLVSVAEINGAALGGGFELALACDIRVAAETAKIGLPEAKLGLLPGAGGTQRMTKLCGAAVARRLILGTEVVEGKEAAHLGLVHWAFPPHELADRTDDIVRRIEGVPRRTLEANKRCIAAAQDRCADGSELEVKMTRVLYESPESLARLHAFLARRKR